MTPLRNPNGSDDDSDSGDLLHDATWLYSFADLMTQLLLFSILTVTLTGISKADMAMDESGLSETARQLEAIVVKRGLSDSR